MSDYYYIIGETPRSQNGKQNIDYLARVKCYLTNLYENARDKISVMLSINAVHY